MKFRLKIVGENRKKERMKTKEFSFELPEELIAQYPSEKRGGSRLFVLKRDGGNTYTNFSEIDNYLDSDTVLVVNNSRVRKARLFVESEFGGQVEFLLISQVSPITGGDGGALSWMVMTSKAKKQRIGKKYLLPEGVQAEITGISESYRVVTFSKAIGDTYLDKHGHMPLPPYIDREDELPDETRYQTVFSKERGSIAAPTAGLHFTPEILKKLEDKGIERIEITLHVGLGTFLPVRAENIVDHEMHYEEYEISAESAKALNRAIREGKKICAVGTTAIRTLESAFSEGKVIEGRRSTNLFIYPGYDFKVVDRVITNFHTPESSLLMLVSAFAGKSRILEAYQEAIEQKFRFYSYGDAMLIL
jgi:S-adenosylmethionine:tRNA ribosyltransferase-isomerase